LKAQWEKLHEELGYLGTHTPLFKHGPKGAADYMKYARKGAHSSNNAIKRVPPSSCQIYYARGDRVHFATMGEGSKFECGALVPVPHITLVKPHTTAFLNQLVKKDR
jgi:hypothetical protein